MKNLKDYLLETKDEETKNEETQQVSDELVVTFNFNGLENAEEIIKSLEEKENIKIEENNVTVIAKKNNIDSLNETINILGEYSKLLNKSQKRASDEQYAQKIKSFTSSLNNLKSYIDQVNNEEE